MILRRPGSAATGPFLLNLAGYPVQRTSQFSWELAGKATTVLDCAGVSVAGGLLLLGDGICDINFNCDELALDDGDCR